ncbi:MAG: aminotransferase class V-fold PLP-dependent enzyme [Bacteroidota bacterium]|nr:aminotransferase class V-fold PLP-dependent enzyme [Bacteroidota bacterium]
MNNLSLNKAILHLKYGSGIVLLLLDFILFVFLSLDIWNIEQTIGVNYLSFVSPYKNLEHSLSSFSFGSFTNFLFLLLLPILIAVFFNYGVFRLNEKQYYKVTTTSSVKDYLLIFHLLLVSFITYHVNFINELQYISGFCGPAEKSHYCFSSYFLFLEMSWFRLTSIFSFVIFIVSLLVNDFMYKKIPEVLNSFEFWYKIGAVGEYQPQYGSEIIYVNIASMAPSIKIVDSARTKYHDQYQRGVPTSDKARNFLFEKANDSRSYLQGYLFNNDEKMKKLFNIEFFTGTSRALEAGILRMDDLSHIVLSNFEHPSQVDVVKWLCERFVQRKISYTSLIPDSPSFFEKQWIEQKNIVCDAIKKDIKGKTGKIAVVLSEVHFITGIHIKVGEIIDELRKENSNLIFIIDGSQAVGNLKKPFQNFSHLLDVNDFYYFSAHKWLLSPNTCGVLISHIKNDDAKRIQPYDMFGFTLPTATIDPNTIFGLSSSLEYLFNSENLFEKFSSISHQLKEYFKKQIGGADSKLKIIQSSTNEVNSSLFLAVEPKFGYKWKYNKDNFWEYIRNNGIDLTFIPETNPYFNIPIPNDENENKNYCLRLSFPYFLIGKNIRNLVKHLDKLIEKAN